MLIISVFAYVGAGCHIIAQTSKLISADNELSDSLIYQVYQDNRDVIWVATEDGLITVHNS